jgi:hypothetical protein
MNGGNRVERKTTAAKSRLPILILAALIGAFSTAVMLEFVLRLLPVSMGLFRTVEHQHWPLRAYSPHEPFTYSRSWELLMVNRGHTNNYGQIAPFDFIPHSRPVIVIGDSFVAGEMIAYADTLQGQLARLVGADVPVYAFGFNGNSISEYLAIGAQAAAEFSPRAAVVLIVDGDMTESLVAHPGHYFFVRENDRMELAYRPIFGRTWFAGLRQSVGDIALFKYVFSNLQFSFDELTASSNPPTRVAGVRNDAALSAVDIFLAEFSRRSGIPTDCTLFLMDSDRYQLYTGRASDVKDAPYVREYFKQAAIARSYRVIDLGPEFAQAYSASREKFDFWPVDRHWNRLGHGMGAQIAVRELRGDARQATSCLN